MAQTQLTERQQTVLQAIYDLDCKTPGGWLRPRELGGCKSSFHGPVLTQFVVWGLVERKLTLGGYAARKTYAYRITAQGRKAARKHDATKLAAVPSQRPR